MSILTILVVLVLLAWLFGNYAPLNNGGPYLNSGPYIGNIGTIVLVVFVLWLLFGGHHYF